LNCQTPRILIAGTGSGCGKTTVTLALLAALRERCRVRAFKCGPDYIDPMFHRSVLGIASGNLDSFLLDADTLGYLFAENSRGADIAVIEGVMGYFDGQAMGDAASSHEIAKILSAPVILVLNGRGKSRSAEAELLGFSRFAGDGLFKGVIFNEVSQPIAEALSDYARSIGIKPLGFLPRMTARLQSRHLGLITPGEIPDLQSQVQALSGAAKKTLDLDGILAMAGSAPCLSVREPAVTPAVRADEVKPKIGVARDEAFCFLYEDNLRLLERLGAKLVYFSPLRDAHLPDGLSGMYLCGGYPEVCAEELSANPSMLKDVRCAVLSGLPVFAECGGFLYLHRSLSDEEGRTYPMAGVIPSDARFTDHLQHFGYVTMRAVKDNLLCGRGGQIRAHEFHRTVSDAPRDAFVVSKGERQWTEYIAKGNLLAGYPHIHFWSDPKLAERFVRTCAKYQKERR
jgi:cobyrinic acid a,c-diamide synthase